MRYLPSVLLLTCAVLAPDEAAAQRSPRRDSEFLTASPRIGERLPDVAVVTPDGQPFNTRQLRGRYTVLTFGCLTWPPFLKNVSSLEAVYRDYAPKNVQFYFIYKSLAHPELEGDYIQPFTLEERLRHARQATAQLGASIPWLVDPMDNRLKHALGDRPNSELVIDPEGKVVRKRAWSDPAALRRDLEELVGLAPKITLAEELNLKSLPPTPAAAPQGILERVPRHGMFALVAEPRIDPDGPRFFAKLRAEGEIRLIDKGRGKLYLGFHLDPLHGAHWNNLDQPLQFELDAPEGVKLSAASGRAPRMEAASDSDPREFLIDVNAWPADARVPLTVTYSVCTGQTCHVVKQQYVLLRERDKDGGGAARSGFRGMTTEAMLKWLLRDDENGDGRLGPLELNSVMRPRMADHDLNADGVLDAGEIEKMAAALTRRRQD